MNIIINTSLGSKKYFKMYIIHESNQIFRARDWKKHFNKQLKGIDCIIKFE